MIDSHAHLTSPLLYGEIDSILSRSKAANVETIINICTDQDTLKKGLKLSEKYPWVYNAGATTPHDVEKEGEFFFPLIADQARKRRLIAIGETGLDYHYNYSTPEMQKTFLIKYLHLALECSLPVIIHCREAFADFFTILDVEYVNNYKHGPGVLHCFTGTIAEAEQLISRGWYISFSGILTFKKNELREVAKMVPLEQLLIETDAPYLAPQSKRGKSNEPSYLPEIAHEISINKKISIEDVIKSTTANARRLFCLSDK
jgi:TatD DNase family protein